MLLGYNKLSTNLLKKEIPLQVENQCITAYPYCKVVRNINLKKITVRFKKLTVISKDWWTHLEDMRKPRPMRASLASKTWYFFLVFYKQDPGVNNKNKRFLMYCLQYRWR